MYDAPATVAPLLLALVLAVSGVAKLLDLSTVGDAFVSLRLPRILVRWRAPQLLPFAELALAVLLLVSSGPVAVGVTSLAVVLFVAYLVVIVRALTFRERVVCSCFGKLGLGAVDRFTAWRNVVLVALAVAALVDACLHCSVLARVSEFSAGEWMWLGGLFAGIALTWLITGHRGDEPASAGTRTGAPAQAAPAAGGRSPIPAGRLRRLDNAPVTLRDLAAEGPALLLYVSPTCGPCARVIEKAREWQRTTDDVHTYLVLPMPPAQEIMGLPNPEVFDLLFDPESELFNLFRTGTPSAILLGESSVVEEPVFGDIAIAELMDNLPARLAPEAHADLDYERRPTPHGLVHTRTGTPVPLISLADTAPTILLMVSPTCGSCLDVIARVPAWREALGLPVAFVVGGQAAAARLDELLDGDAGTVYFDANHTLLSTFSVGTPALVALGPDRLLLAGPVVGNDAVTEAMSDIIAEVTGARPTY